MAAPYYGMIDEVHVVLVDDDKEFVNNMVDLLKSYDYKEDTPYWTKLLALLCTYCDSQDVIDRAGSMIYNGKSRHIKWRHNTIRELLSSEIITVDYVRSKDNVLIPLTKDPSRKGVKSSLKGMDLRPRTSHHCVMVVGTALDAMAMLSKGKQKIDVMILNIHSSNTLSFHLLARVVALDIISLVVWDEQNELVVKKAFDEGAYLCLKKPFDKDITKYIWQFVVGEKLKREKARKGFENNKNQMNKIVKRKNCTEWTEALHAKFMEAVQLLGEGRCYPKEILEVMNVPGLTRMQVASHLQKCRRNDWRSPKERKSLHRPLGQGSSSDFHESRSNGIVSSRNIRNEISNGYNLNVSMDNVTSYSSNATMYDTYVGNVAINGLEEENPNVQQYIGEPNISNMNNPFQKLEPPSASLHNEQDNDFDQVYYDD
ncbi:hypothetical protein BC332_23287 [Capsicum chinense]|nr:hypothetical protein BC332_23287 [Capsicum chinense]